MTVLTDEHGRIRTRNGKILVGRCACDCGNGGLDDIYPPGECCCPPFYLCSFGGSGKKSNITSVSDMLAAAAGLGVTLYGRIGSRYVLNRPNPQIQFIGEFKVRANGIIADESYEYGYRGDSASQDISIDTPVPCSCGENDDCQWDFRRDGKCFCYSNWVASASINFRMRADGYSDPTFSAYASFSLRNWHSTSGLSGFAGGSRDQYVEAYVVISGADSYSTDCGLAGDEIVHASCLGESVQTSGWNFGWATTPNWSYIDKNHGSNHYKFELWSRCQQGT